MIDDCAEDQTQTQTQTQPNPDENQAEENSQLHNADQKTPWGRIISKRITVNRLGYSNGRLETILSASFDLCEEIFSIGRSPEADWSVTDQHTIPKILERISKVHCRIIKDCGSIESPVYIEDLSRNGTFLNDQLIGYQNKRILKTDDVISLNDPNYKFFQFINLAQETHGIPAEIFEQYFIGKQLGSGGQGTVRLAIDRATCEEFALKIVKRAYDTNNRFSTITDERIMREAAIMSEISHPNIIKCRKFLIIQDSIYMFLEYMKGGDLLHFIQSKKFLTVATTKFFFLQLCAAVKHLHDEGIIHRDIKPENILLKCKDEETELKLSDFGLSKLFVNENSETHTLCGTPLYVSPEIQSKSGRVKYTNKVDVWSLGVVLYAMFSGKLPFVNGEKETSSQRILAGKFDFRHYVWRYVPENAKDLIKTMLTVDPNKRSSIDDVLNHPWLKYDYCSMSAMSAMSAVEITKTPLKKRRID